MAAPSMVAEILVRSICLHACVLSTSALQSVVRRKSMLKSATTYESVFDDKGKASTPQLRSGGGRDTSSASFRVIVLNLDRRPDRLHRATMVMRDKLPGARVCRQRSLDGSRMEDVGHLTVSPRIVESIFEPPAAVACYGTHYFAWERVAQDKSIDFAVVVEDDLSLFSDDFHDQFSKLLQKDFWNDKEWVYLQSDDSTWPKQTGIRSKQPTELMKGGWRKNTAMYAITPSAARSLMQWSKENYMRVSQTFDAYVPNMALSSHFAFVPPIAQVNGTIYDTNIWIRLRSNRSEAVEPLSECEAIDSW